MRETDEWCEQRRDYGSVGLYRRKDFHILDGIRFRKKEIKKTFFYWGNKYTHKLFCFKLDPQAICDSLSKTEKEKRNFLTSPFITRKLFLWNWGCDCGGVCVCLYQIFPTTWSMSRINVASSYFSNIFLVIVANSRNIKSFITFYFYVMVQQ